MKKYNFKREMRKTLISCLFVPNLLYAYPVQHIEVRKDDKSFVLDITETPTPPIGTTHTLEAITQPDPTARVIDMASPDWDHLTRTERMKHFCVNNKTAIIAGVATLSSATIAGIVALIVHFTAA